VQRTALILTVMTLASGTALADDRNSATLAEPLAHKQEYILNGNVFRCELSLCRLVSDPVDPGSLLNCRALKRKVGTLTSFVAGGKPFEPEKLAKCNADN
jgi:hypothetical protein